MPNEIRHKKWWKIFLNRGSFWFLKSPELVGSSRFEVFLGKYVLKMCGKFTGEHQCRGVTSMNLQSNFTLITFRHGCSPLNLLHIFTGHILAVSRYLFHSVSCVRVSHAWGCPFSKYFLILSIFVQIVK